MRTPCTNEILLKAIKASGTTYEICAEHIGINKNPFRNKINNEEQNGYYSYFRYHEIKLLAGLLIESAELKQKLFAAYYLEYFRGIEPELSAEGLPELASYCSKIYKDIGRDLKKQIQNLPEAGRQNADVISGLIINAFAIDAFDEKARKTADGIAENIAMKFANKSTAKGLEQALQIEAPIPRFKALLKLARESCKVSQTGAGRVCSVTRQTIQMAESAHHPYVLSPSHFPGLLSHYMCKGLVGEIAEPLKEAAERVKVAPKSPQVLKKRPEYDPERMRDYFARKQAKATLPLPSRQ